MADKYIILITILGVVASGAALAYNTHQRSKRQESKDKEKMNKADSLLKEGKQAAEEIVDVLKQKEQEEPKKLYTWQLDITMKTGNVVSMTSKYDEKYRWTEIPFFMNFHKWFYTKNTPYYHFQYSNGSCHTVVRDNVSTIYMHYIGLTNADK